MAEQFDIDAGILGEDQALALRNFEALRSDGPIASEERFGLVGGFADIMAAVGLFLVMGTLIGVITQAPIVGLLFALGCWWAATYFTARRRLTLASFVIFGGYALASTMASLAIALALLSEPNPPGNLMPRNLPPLASIITASAAAAACLIYWRKFRLPISFAAFAVAFVNFAVNTVQFLVPSLPALGVQVVLAAGGFALFALAMWWDVSDIRRETVRSDVAFWLHVAAGFLIVKSAMSFILGRKGPSDGWDLMFSQINQSTGVVTAISVVVVFAIFATVALIIDRRSLLTSGMFYLVPAMGSLLGGPTEAIVPALFVGGLMLIGLAIRWTPMRAALLRRLPKWIQAQVPRSEITNPGRRPTRRHLELQPRRIASSS